jgi:hypothetical protein
VNAKIKFVLKFYVCQHWHGHALVHKAVKLANDGSGVDVDGRASLRTLAASGRLALCCPSGACQPSSLTSPVAAHVPMPTRRPQFISATDSRPPGGELGGQREAELLHSRTRSPRWASQSGVAVLA